MFLSRWLKSTPATKRSTQPASRFRPALEALDARDLPSGGVLDPTFGGDGVVSTLLANGNRAAAVTAAPDGKVIAVGYSYGNSLTTNFAVTRYNTDGTLDATFGNGGSVNSQPGKGFAVAVQPDGKILVAGRSGTGDDFAVVRYSASGTLDKSFGKNGVATIDIASRSVDDGRAMVLQPDGKIVVAGTTRAANQTAARIALVRLTANGALDTSFGSGGKVVRSPAAGAVPQLTPEDRGLALAIDPGTGKLVAASTLHYANPGTVVLRFDPNGTLDTSFSGDGELALTDLRDTCSVAVQADHKIVVAGTHYDGSGWTSGDDFGMVRLNPDGTGDAAFGTGGLVVTPEPLDSGAKDMEIQPDGRIVLFGNHGTDPMMTRYNAADGSLDPTFGTNGFVIGSGMGPMNCGDMTLDSAGRIVIAGANSGEVYSIVARFLATGPAITSFTSGSAAVAAGDPVTLTAGVTAPNPGSSVTQVAIYADTNGDGKLDSSDSLIGYATQTSTGTWTLTVSTAGWTIGSYRLFAQATDSLGAVGDPISLDLTVT